MGDLRRSWSTAAGRNGVVNVRDIGIKAAKIAIALRPALAQGGDGARLHHFEEIEAGGGAGF
jgi:hypothetical protein